MKLGEILKKKAPEMNKKIVSLYLRELKELLEKGDVAKARSVAEKAMDFMSEQIRQEFYYRVYMPLFDSPREIRRKAFS